MSGTRHPRWRVIIANETQDFDNAIGRNTIHQLVGRLGDAPVAGRSPAAVDNRVAAESGPHRHGPRAKSGGVSAHVFHGNHQQDEVAISSVATVFLSAVFKDCIEVTAGACRQPE